MPLFTMKRPPILAKLEYLLKAEKDEWKRIQLSNTQLLTGTTTNRKLHLDGYRFDEQDCGFVFGKLDDSGKEVVPISIFESEIEPLLEEIYERHYK